MLSLEVKNNLASVVKGGVEIVERKVLGIQTRWQRIAESLSVRYSLHCLNNLASFSITTLIKYILVEGRLELILERGRRLNQPY